MFLVKLQEKFEIDHSWEWKTPGPGSSKADWTNPELVKFFISIYNPANCMCLNGERLVSFVWFSTSQCRRFGRESVSYSQINWQASFNLNVAKCNLGKVKLEMCWPAVYHVGCPTRSQGPLVAHVLAVLAVLAVPALSFSRMIAHQSLLLLPPPSPLGKYGPCCSPLVVQCDRCLVLGGHRVAMDTATLGWYSIWWPFHHQAPTPHAHQSMSLIQDEANQALRNRTQV